VEVVSAPYEYGPNPLDEASRLAWPRSEKNDIDNDYRY
jgi:hypothetical protein